MNKVHEKWIPVYLIRHGMTQGNFEGRYVGKTDEGILAEERPRLRELRGKLLERMCFGHTALFSDQPHLPENSSDQTTMQGNAFGQSVDDSVPRIYLAVSPLLRARETAEILFPEAEQHLFEGLSECDFGRFEYHTYEELKDDPDYRHFLETTGKSGFPGGEAYEDFCSRNAAAFAEAVRAVQKEYGKEHDIGCAGRERCLVIVAHGGSIRAILQRYAAEQRGFYEWPAGNGCVYRTWWNAEQEQLRDAEMLFD